MSFSKISIQEKKMAEKIFDAPKQTELVNTIQAPTFNTTPVFEPSLPSPNFNMEDAFGNKPF